MNKLRTAALAACVIILALGVVRCIRQGYREVTSQEGVRLTERLLQRRLPAAMTNFYAAERRYGQSCSVLLRCDVPPASMSNFLVSFSPPLLPIQVRNAHWRQNLPLASHLHWWDLHRLEKTDLAGYSKSGLDTELTVGIHCVLMSNGWVRMYLEVDTAKTGTM